LTTTAGSSIRENLCAVFSKANGESAAGTAPNWDSCLIIELPKPWVSDAYESKGFQSGVLDILDRIEELGRFPKLQCMAPDDEYSLDGHTRIIYYSCPDGPFTRYDKDDYLVPDDKVVSAVEALVEDRDKLKDFESYRQDTSHIRDVFVCSHGSNDTCCATFGYPIYKELRNRYAQELDGRLRVWEISHLGGHRFAPNILDMPEARNWVRFEPDDLDSFVYRSGTPSDLREHYRGWVGLGSVYEQLVESELFMKEGWGWADQAIVSQVLSSDDETGHAEVRIELGGSDGGTALIYEATVEQTGTAPRIGCISGESDDSEPQFSVTRLVQVQ